MKKVPKSITVTVEQGHHSYGYARVHVEPGIELTSLNVVCLGEIREYFGRLPKAPYKVTYRENPRGQFRAALLGNYSIHIRRHNKYGEFGVIACFIPNDWDGLRVSRKVTPIRVKK